MPKWGGRPAQRARTYVLNRDHGICHICRHPGANSLDHLVSKLLHPELTWDPTNWAAAHMQRAGQPGGCQHPGCTCIGNRLRAAGTGTHPTPDDPKPTREW